MAILEVGGDVYKISTESVLGTFGHRIEQFLDKEYQSSTFIKYIIRRPKEPTVAIIEYCNTGLLHIPPNVCKGSFQTELQFWGLNPSLLEKCCYHKFCSFLNDQKKLEGFENMYKRNTNIGNKKRPTVKERTWEVVSCQGKSKWSKV